MKLLMLDRIYINTVYVFFVAAIWTVLFFANGYIFDAVEVAPLVSFVFSPCRVTTRCRVAFWCAGCDWIDTRRSVDHPHSRDRKYLDSINGHF